jgi:hypothetical protein
MAQHYKTGPKKGQFKSGRRNTPRGGKKNKKKKRGKKKRAAATPKKRRSNPVAKSKKKKRRSRRRGKAGRMTAKEKQELTIAAVGVGYIEENTEMLAKLPMATESGSKKNIIYAVALHYIGKQFSGDAGKWLDRGSAVYAVRAGLKFGAAKFTMQGDDSRPELGADIYDATGHDDNEVSGEIGDAG